MFLHPNPREPFGIGPLEAMAAGVPLVAPDQGGVMSYATGENAWLTSPEPAAFAAAIRRALEDSVERRQRVANAVSTARRFNWPTAAARIFRTYDRVHQGRVARVPRRRTTPHPVLDAETDHLTV